MNGDQLVEKRCRTSVLQKRERVKSDAVLKSVEPCLNVQSEYKSAQETVITKSRPSTVTQ